MCTPQMFEPHDGMPPQTKELLYIKDLARLERIVAEIRQLKAEGYAIHASDHGLDEMLKLYRTDKGKSSTMHGQKTEMDPDDPVCNIGTDNMWLHDGHVKLCPYHLPIGNVVTDTATLKQMWDGEITRLPAYVHHFLPTAHAADAQGEYVSEDRLTCQLPAVTQSVALTCSPIHYLSGQEAR